MIDLLDAANLVAAGRFDTGEPAPWVDGDFNHDRLVDILDAAAFMGTGLFDQGFYEESASGAVAAVPEPSSAALLSVAVAVVVGAWSRRPRG